MTTKRLLRRALSIPEILRWADAHRETHGKWPTKESGDVVSARFESWSAVDAALRSGNRTLPGGSSLARLLAVHRGARNIQDLPPLTEDQILEWADEHRARTGTWPNGDSGPVLRTKEKWHGIDHALIVGSRDLTPGSSIAKLLARHRGTRNRKQLPPLTEAEILEWADAHHRRSGSWPTAKSGPIVDAPGETWLAVDMALRHGRRRFTGGSSLAMLLAAQRNARNVWTRPDLTISMILAWVDAFHAANGRWPSVNDGAIAEAPEETWLAVNHALNRGSRGVPGGRSLARLIADERGVRSQIALPLLSRKAILAWATAHHRRTGKWPTADSGPIEEAPGETWAGMQAALTQGSRGLRAGSSLARLLAAHGKKRNHLDLPPLSRKKILGWADAHFHATGEWPNVRSGAVADAPEERWDLIDNALRQGHRKLTGGSSLLLLLVAKRGVRNPRASPPLTEEAVLRWATLHRERTGTWPKYKSGPIADAPGETWASVDWALRYGKRRLSPGSSLAKLLAAAVDGWFSTGARYFGR
jgi:hypothetical protein